MKILICLTISLTILIANCCLAKTWYVKPDSTGEVIDLQTAIDVAADGDTILASAGTYSGEGNCGLDFSGKAIVMTTEYGPDSTTLACEGPVFNFVSGEDSNSVLDGYSIFAFHGIKCINASPIIRNNQIRTDMGIGIYLHETKSIIKDNFILSDRISVYCENDSSLIIDNSIHGDDFCWLIDCNSSYNRIISNTFSHGNGVRCHKGTIVFQFNRIYSTYLAPGIRCDSSTSIISDNIIGSIGSGIVISSGSYTIANNRIWCGAIYNNGGGVRCYDLDSSTIISGNIIFNSWLEYGNGGGIYCEQASPIISNNVIAYNEATRGGAIYCTASSPLIINNTLEGNHSWQPGSGIYLTNDSDPTIQRCIIANGSGYYSQSPIYGIYAEDAASQPIISCCDVYNNETGNYGGYISDQNGINGNFGADPLFCDPEEGIYTIHIESPCAPGNHPDGVDCGLIGAYQVGCGFFEAAIDIDPNTLNLESRGKWITCYIELPEEYDVTNIDIGSIRFDYSIPAESNPNVTGDYDGDFIPDLMVKFDRSEIIDLFSSRDVVREVAIVTVTGNVGSEHFRGTDCIRVKGQPHTFLEPEAAVSQAEAFSLGIHPNPFNPATTISYSIPRSSYTTLKIYDVSGSLVRVLVDGIREAGVHREIWDARGDYGREVSSGIYFYRLVAGDFVQTKKMVLLR